MRRRFLLAIPVVCLSGCAATVGVDGFFTQVPEDAADTCSKHCERVGLELSAVAIMANAVGCICEPADKTAKGNASAASGMMSLMVDKEKEREHQRQQENP